MLRMLFVSLLLLAAVHGHAESQQASCHDPQGVGGLAGHWLVEYDVVATNDGPRADLHAVSFRPDNVGVPLFSSIPLADARWKLFVKTADKPGYVAMEMVTGELLDNSKHAAFRNMDLYPILQTPNKHCAIFLRTYQYLPQLPARDKKALKVAIAGDSLTQKFTWSIAERRKLASMFAFNSWQMEVYALGGMPWQRVPGTAEGENTLDEIRGLLATRPDVFLFALGTNDALQIMSTRVVKTAYTTEHMRHYTALQIAAILGEVDAADPNMCKVLVTPSTHPFYVFGEYSEEAIFVGDLLRFFAGQPTQTDISKYVLNRQPFRNMRIADWAKFSAGKDKRAWFPDGIHMTDEGSDAFIKLWMQEIAACVATKNAGTDSSGAAP